MKNICILGSTGSIGQNSLEVIANFPDRFRVCYLSTNKNIELLQKQITRFKPKGVAVMDDGAASVLKQMTNGSLQVCPGSEGMHELATRNDVDVVVTSL